MIREVSTPPRRVPDVGQVLDLRPEDWEYHDGSRRLVLLVAGVRADLSRWVVPLCHGDQVIFRMPTPLERADLGIPVGVPIAVIARQGGGVERHACDRTALRAPEEPGPAGRPSTGDGP